MAWEGGKVSSNKRQALLKFYQRKKHTLNEKQLQALQEQSKS